MSTDYNDDIGDALGLSDFGRKKAAAPSTPKAAQRTAVPSRPTEQSQPVTPLGRLSKAEDVLVPRSPQMAPLDRSEPGVQVATVGPRTPLERPRAALGLSGTPRRQNARSKREAGGGRSVTLRLPIELYDHIETKADELGAKSVGHLVLVLLSAAGSDPSLHGPITQATVEPQAGASGRALVIALLGKVSGATFTRQLTLRVPRATYERATEAARTAGEKKLAPFFVALVERQLRSL